MVSACLVVQPAPDQLASQGKHTPFAFEHGGVQMPGRVRATLVAGRVTAPRPVRSFAGTGLRTTAADAESGRTSPAASR